MQNLSINKSAYSPLPCNSISFHPDFTVGTGISPVHVIRIMYHSRTY